MIESAVRGVVGIHIRKSHGVQGSYFRNKREGPYDNIDNIVYIKFIEKILKFNPKQKFYLSSDLPLKSMKFLLDKYEMITYKDIVKDYDLKIENNSFRDKISNYKVNIIKLNTLKDIIDLFGLSFCSYLISHPNSTWSEFAYRYRRKPFVTPDIGNINTFIKMIGNFK